MRTTVLLPLLSGLALGGAAGWLLSRPADAPHPAASGAETAGPLRIPAWSWRDSPAPPILAPDLLGPAIAAWRGLRAPDGSPASYAVRADALRALLTRLPADGFPRLLSTLASADTEADRRFRQLAFDIWTETDAPDAARWAATAGSDLLDLARRAVSVWAELDAPAAAAWACALRDPETAAALASLALAELAKSDPARALALAGSRDAAFQKDVFPALFNNLAKSDPAAALRIHGPAIWNNGEGFSKLAGALRAWAKKDPETALAWLAAQTRSHSGQLKHWVSQLAETREESLRLASALARDPSISDRSDALAWLLRYNAENEPAQALAWLDANTDSHLRAQVLREMGNSYPSGRPETVLPYTLALPPGQQRTQSIANTLESWTRIDPAAALAWLQEQDDPGVRAAGAKVQAALLADIARTEPQTAIAEWEALADPQAKRLAIRRIAEAWGKTDPAAALPWAAAQQRALDPGSGRTPPMQLLYPWAQKDPEAALRWAESYAATLEGPHRDAHAVEALLALGRGENDQLPRAQTAELYLKIQDTALRSRVLNDHVQSWLAQDPAAAKTWLETHDAISPEGAARLLATGK